MTRQRVFVVDRAAFFDGDWPQGYHRIDDGDELLRQALREGRFVDREQAERTRAWKQWIPYCMLRCGDWSPEGDPRQRGVLLVQRTRRGGEARLHGSWTVGLGGHIEPVDADLPDGARVDPKAFFQQALQRELDEELALPDAPLPPAKLVGLINDDSTEVGSVHAGLVYSLDVGMPLADAQACFAIRETDKMRGGFAHLVDLAQVWQTRSQFESWSQFLIEAEIVVAMGGKSWSGATAARREAGDES